MRPRPPCRDRWQSALADQTVNKRFDYDDVVRVREDASPELRPGAVAWIVGVFEDRPGPYFDKFPPDVVYSIEYEDGTSSEIAQRDIEHKEKQK